MSKVEGSTTCSSSLRHSIFSVHHSIFHFGEEPFAHRAPFRKGFRTLGNVEYRMLNVEGRREYDLLLFTSTFDIQCSSFDIPFRGGTIRAPSAIPKRIPNPGKCRISNAECRRSKGVRPAPLHFDIRYSVFIIRYSISGRNHSRTERHSEKDSEPWEMSNIEC